MPIGLVIMKWDERLGTDVTAKYPEETELSPSTLMQIYSQHEFSGESGFVSLISGGINIASYYTGPESNYYIILLLELDEDADIYEEGLADVSRQILMNLDNDVYKKLIPSLFQRISVYPKLDDSQRLALLYQTEIKRMVIQRLREEAAVTKAELTVWLKDKYASGFFDIESILLGMIKVGIIKVASVKGMASEIVFLVRDILISRVPPVKLIDDIENRGLPPELKESYKTEVINFFKDYVPSEEDNLKLIEDIILDPQVYETLKLIRQAAVTRDDIEKLRKKGVEDIDYVLKKLWDNKVIFVFQDNAGNEYYCLASDIRIELFFPDYLIDVVRRAYSKKTQNKEVLVEELEMLKE
ncbi:MAG: hypothetical protein ACTSXF_10395, partial [Promethearchaeota archaeon]